jgi:FKBP-type peptidyl-prolyl cis-trans isomerase 2
MHKAHAGDRARIRYSRLSAQVNDKKEYAPPKTIEFIVGSHEVPACVSTGVVGMALGDHRFFRLWMGKDGRLGESAVRRIRRERLGRHRNLQVGEQLRFVDRNTGRHLDMTIIRLTPTWVLLARNDHPESNVEVDVSLVSLDSSATTNQEQPQFDIGGQG